METKSPFLAMQLVEGQLKTLLRSVDIEALNTTEKKMVSSLRRLAIDVRLDIRDYELSETREEQVKYAVSAKRRLKRLQDSILSLGSIFGAADTAQLTAHMEQISAWLI